MSLGKVERVDEESNKKEYKEDRAVNHKNCDITHKSSFMYFLSITQSFFLGFSWTSDNFTVSNKKRTSRIEPTIESETTI